VGVVTAVDDGAFDIDDEAVSFQTVRMTWRVVEPPNPSPSGRPTGSPRSGFSSRSSSPWRSLQLSRCSDLSKTCACLISLARGASARHKCSTKNRCDATIAPDPPAAPERQGGHQQTSS
jgi:hypothetical protein